MGFLMARRAEGDQILGSVIAQSAPRLNVMDLKIFHPPARLATPAVSLQDFAAELAISFRIKPQAWPLWHGSLSKRAPALLQGVASAAASEDQ